MKYVQKVTKKCAKADKQPTAPRIGKRLQSRLQQRSKKEQLLSKIETSAKQIQHDRDVAKYGSALATVNQFSDAIELLQKSEGVADLKNKLSGLYKDLYHLAGRQGKQRDADQQALQLLRKELDNPLPLDQLYAKVHASAVEYNKSKTKIRQEISEVKSQVTSLA